MGLLFDDNDSADIGFASTTEAEDSRAVVPDCPEKELLLAVLFDGIQTYITNAKSNTTEGKRKYKEAQTWIIVDESDYVFSFDNLCDAVGIDANCLRSALLKGYSSSEGSLG